VVSQGENKMKQNEANEANASNSKQNEANEAVNVSVNVNASVSVTANGTVSYKGMNGTLPDKPENDSVSLYV